MSRVSYSVVSQTCSMPSLPRTDCPRPRRVWFWNGNRQQLILIAALAVCVATVVSLGSLYHVCRTSQARQNIIVEKAPALVEQTVQQCGWAYFDHVQRIMGGNPASEDTWPWQVALVDSTNQLFCGGTLIGDRWVLTAGHCVDEHRGIIYAVLGSITPTEYSPSQQKIRVKTTIIHFDYLRNGFAPKNDIALLHLSRPASFNNHVIPACLPASEPELVPGTRCTIIGWGKQHRKLNASNSLMQAELPVAEVELCKDVRFRDFPEEKTVICAGSADKAVDACSGDSGGPLLCRSPSSTLASKRQGRTPDTLWTVFGITSSGKRCENTPSYGLYTKVAYYLDWITNITFVKSPDFDAAEQDEDRPAVYQMMVNARIKEICIAEEISLASNEKEAAGLKSEL